MRSFSPYPYFIFFTLLGVGLLNSSALFGQKKYTAEYILIHKDSTETQTLPVITTAFATREDAITYVNKLPSTLMDKGFASASIDSVFFDSAFAKIFIYLGKKYEWASLNTDSISKASLENAGYNARQFIGKPLSFSHLRTIKDRLLTGFENSGYPFAEVGLANIKMKDDRISGDLFAKKGTLYHLDSIRVYGIVKIKNSYLQHYLGIDNGSIYNGSLINKVSQKISELPFLQEQSPADVSMLGTGATLNLYLVPKRSSEINVLIGFSPANTLTGKAAITADVHLDLKNALGSGENILLNWQQLQPSSPRLNIGYRQPFIFNSNFGINSAFDLLKRDSAYLQINGTLGVQYFISSRQLLNIFYQAANSFLLAGGVDTNQVKFSKRLPAIIDVRSSNIGVGYEYANTNYRLNPRRGYELKITSSAGIKKIVRNNDIINLKDPADPAFNFNTLYDSLKLTSYQLKIAGSGAHYFDLGKNNVLKAAASAGLLQSPNLFQNELFRIGGYRLLRGFDEESIYASSYTVFTGEYRYLIGLNSFFFLFSDAGFTSSKIINQKYSNSFLSGGVGLELETKFGLLNLSYAVGKRNDVKFDLRNSSKIHFGYINYF